MHPAVVSLKDYLIILIAEIPNSVFHKRSTTSAYHTIQKWFLQLLLMTDVTDYSFLYLTLIVIDILTPWTDNLSHHSIFFIADILTPLPALGVDFTIIPGKGPKILNPLRTTEDVAALKPMHDVALQVPFLGPILQVLHFLVFKCFFLFICVCLCFCECFCSVVSGGGRGAEWERVWERDWMKRV